MKLSDIPKHVTEMDPPWFSQEFGKKYGYDSHLKYEEVTPVFHLDYYDGPLSGIVIFGGHHFYVESIYFEDKCWWASWELTPQELQTALENNRIFEENVGSHTRYFRDEEGDLQRDLSLVKPQETWGNYYKNDQVPKVDYNAVKEREIFGILHNPFRSW